MEDKEKTTVQYYKNRRFGFVIQVTEKNSYIKFDETWLVNSEAECYVGKVVHDPKGTWGIGKESMFWACDGFEPCSNLVYEIGKHYWVCTDLAKDEEIEGTVMLINGCIYVDFDNSDNYSEEIEDYIKKNHKL